MFISFGMSTFLQLEIPDGKAPAPVYNPDQLDVDQWIQVARDAGMKYAVLTAKHVAGHCLWPSRYSDYTIVNSANKIDVVAAFVKACDKRGVLPGLYYNCWDNHHLFGSLTQSYVDDGEKAYTTSLYQDFQTAQLAELLTNYGPITELWIDIPKVLGFGYRSFLYHHMASLQKDIFIVMNNGPSDGTSIRGKNWAWPTDIITMEKRLPPPSGHLKWMEIEGKRYYLAGEVCDTVTQNWFWVEGDRPRPDEELASLLLESRRRGANLLLDVGPDKHGLVPVEQCDALIRLRKNAGL
jgi:alpha-L-fucosidase